MAVEVQAEAEESEGFMEAQSWLSNELKKKGIPEINLSNGGVGGVAGAVLTNGLKQEVAKKAFVHLDSDTLSVIASAAVGVLAERAKKN